MEAAMKTLFSIMLIFLFLSCGGGKKTSENVVPDEDFDNRDDEEVYEYDENTGSDDPASHSGEKPDRDTYFDPDECYPLVSDAPFPYYDNGKITFCRPLCDTPTKEDPICLGNIWEEQNEKVCHEFPHYSCCGHPCVMEILKSETKDELAEFHPTLVEYIPMHRCDRIVDPVGWAFDGSLGNVKSWNLSGGKIAFELYPSQSMYDGVKEWWVASKYATYDTATQKYTLIIPSRTQEQVYYKGHRLALISDKRALELNNSNIFLAYIGDDATVEIVYDKIVSSISYEPALNEKWAFVNLVSDFEGKRMLYAKIGEWKWTSLGYGLGFDPGIVGDTLALVDEDVNGWICDLEKYPKSLSECRKVNRDDEWVMGIRINSENEREFVFNSNMLKIVHLELDENDEFVYKDLITDFTEETWSHRYSLAPEQFRGNTVMYEEVTTNQYEEGGGRICYYRLDKEKRYCMNPMEDDKTYEDGSTRFYALYAEFEGKWLAFQLRRGSVLMLRDMECYCLEEGVCPFEE